MLSTLHLTALPLLRYHPLCSPPALYIQPLSHGLSAPWQFHPHATVLALSPVTFFTNSREATHIYYPVVFVAQESGHSLEGFSALGSHQAAIQVSTGAVGLSDAHLGRDPLSDSLRVWAEFISSGGRTKSLCSCWPLAGSCSSHLEAAHTPFPSSQSLSQHGSLLL